MREEVPSSAKVTEYDRVKLSEAFHFLPWLLELRSCVAHFWILKVKLKDGGFRCGNLSKQLNGSLAHLGTCLRPGSYEAEKAGTLSKILQTSGDLFDLETTSSVRTHLPF